MLTDTETGEVVVGDGEDKGLGLESDPVGGDETGEGHEDDEGGVQPVDVLVCEGDIVSILFCRFLSREKHVLTPVAPGDGHLGNVRLLEIVLLASERDEVGGAIGDVHSLNLRRDIRGRSRRHGVGVVVE